MKDRDDIDEIAHGNVYDEVGKSWHCKFTCVVRAVHSTCKREELQRTEDHVVDTLDHAVSLPRIVLRDVSGNLLEVGKRLLAEDYAHALLTP